VLDTAGRSGQSVDDVTRGDPALRVKRRLSTRLLLLTALAVMLAEVLIFVPSISKFRHDWLSGKIETVAVAGLASEEISSETGSVLGPDQETALLAALDAYLIAINDADSSRLLARAETIGMTEIQVDLETETPWSMIAGAFDTLIFGGDRIMRVFGPVGDGSVSAEVVMSERPLRMAMLTYSRNIFLLSLSVALFAALLVYTAISRFLVRPIEHMTGSMVRFAANPADRDRIIRPSDRDDEIGIAEVQLADMQTRLADTLREQRHLADLGLAVSKINHDLRNVLASTQMISDRLATIDDPQVQRFAPLLLRSLDRALAYTQSVLAYGRAVESAPKRREVRLRLLVEDVCETLAIDPTVRIDFINSVPSDLLLMVDPDQFHRLLSNLCRNAVEALNEQADEHGAALREVRVGTVSERSQGGQEGHIVVFVEDTGPGLPDKARENLFKAFRGSARSGGTGLGLAIAAEIVEAHGGEITLAECDQPGTRFEIRLPASVARRAEATVEPAS